jgi:DNA replication protein DnaC
MTNGDRLPYLLRALKAPRILERLASTAERARADGWPYEQFLETLCEAEVFAREASGARTRIRAAAFPAPKTLEDFDFAAQPGAERPLILHLAQLAWIDEAANVCFLGPPDPGSQCFLSIMVEQRVQLRRREPRCEGRFCGPG